MLKAKNSVLRGAVLSLIALIAVCASIRLPKAAYGAVDVSDKPDTPFKLATFTTEGKTRVGIVFGDQVLDLAGANAYVEKQAHLTKMQLPDEMKALIEQYPTVSKRLYQIANYLKSVSLNGKPFVYSADKVTIEPPVKYPWNLMNMAFNYWGHAKELTGRLPDIDQDRDDPFIFAKSPRSDMIGTDATFYIPEGREKMDWEGELIVVMGPKPASRVSKEQALDYVFGYSVINDLSDRQPGKRKAPTFSVDWFSQKNRDGAAPVGPYITPKEFMGNPHDFHLTTKVNGVIKQDGSTSDMIYDVEHQIAYITSIMTLWPGDMIACGSQAGVGTARKPPEYLKAGDVVEVSADGIGTLRTHMAAMPPKQ